MLKQIVSFMFSGAVAFLVDAVGYILLMSVMPTFWAKQGSFILATTVSFVFNRFLTFAESKLALRTITVFIGYYLAMAWANPGLNEFALRLTGNVAVSFVLATAFTAAANFAAMKFIIFR